jgi:hypothetical protein
LLFVRILMQAEDVGGAGGGGQGGNAGDHSNDPVAAHDKGVTGSKDANDVAQDTVEDDHDPEV